MEQVLVRLEGLRDRIIPLEWFGWPLPERLACNTRAGNEEHYMFADAEGLDPSEGIEIFRKISESELEAGTGFLRGAVYARENERSEKIQQDLMILREQGVPAEFVKVDDLGYHYRTLDPQISFYFDDANRKIVITEI